MTKKPLVYILLTMFMTWSIQGCCSDPTEVNEWELEGALHPAPVEMPPSDEGLDEHIRP
jgi:hypothetical protein